MKNVKKRISKQTATANKLSDKSPNTYTYRQYEYHCSESHNCVIME